MGSKVSTFKSIQNGGFVNKVEFNSSSFKSLHMASQVTQNISRCFRIPSRYGKCKNAGDLISILDMPSEEVEIIVNKTKAGGMVKLGHTKVYDNTKQKACLCDTFPSIIITTEETSKAKEELPVRLKSHYSRSTTYITKHSPYLVP